MNSPQPSNVNNSWEECPTGAIHQMVQRQRQNRLAKRLARLGAALVTVGIAAALLIIVRPLWLPQPAPQMAISCGEVRDLRAQFARNDVKLRLRQQVERHLEKCPSCRRYYAEIGQLGAAHRAAHRLKSHQAAKPEPVLAFLPY